MAISRLKKEKEKEKEKRGYEVLFIPKIHLFLYPFIYSIGIESACCINLLCLIAVTIRRSVTYGFQELFVLEYTLDELFWITTCKELIVALILNEWQVNFCISFVIVNLYCSTASEHSNLLTTSAVMFLVCLFLFLFLIL